MNMETKDIHIYKEIEKAAHEVFANMNAKPGAYTAKEIEKSIYKEIFFCNDFDKNKAYTIEVDGFKCSFLAHDVFRVLLSYEKIFKIRKQEKAVFTRVEKEENTAVSFELPKQAKNLAKSVSGKNEHTYTTETQYVCIDTESRAMVATNGHIMTVISLPDMKVSENASGQYILSPDMVKHGKGVLSIGKDGVAVCGNDAEECYNSGRDYSRFPNWRSVCNRVHTPIDLGAKFKEIKKIAKSVGKESTHGHIIVSGCKDSECLTIQGRNESKGQNISYSVNIGNALQFDFSICVNHEFINKVPCADTLYIYSSGIFSFVWDGGFSIIMPVMKEGNIYPSYEGDGLNLLEISGIDKREQPCNGNNIETVSVSVKNEQVIEARKPEISTIYKPKSETLHAKRFTMMQTRISRRMRRLLAISNYASRINKESAISGRQIQFGGSNHIMLRSMREAGKSPPYISKKRTKLK